MQILWFKRDLRVHDNEALIAAANQGDFIPIYIFEPQLWQQPDMSYRHYQFLKESIIELKQDLANIGLNLTIKTGDVVAILNELRTKYDITRLISHQETWNGWTYQRDLDVKSFCHKNNIKWYELTQNGVIRRLNDRDGWASIWYHKMKKPILNVPKTFKSINHESCNGKIPTASELGLKQENINIQKGGRSEGLKLLNSFLYQRGEGYSKEMSSPVTAFESCSRLSAHIAFGTLSIKEIFQTCERRNDEIKHLPRGFKGKWSSAMRSFSGRLRWHCHFIQKLEDEPRIEFQNMHPAYNNLRENDFREDCFIAWQEGKTGYPMVDACMRALTQTGWINFRMRAMLMSFASYHLWLHWRKTALHLAQLFTDYEPGIHYSQVQMQSGTTGINSIRIYNPIKQGIDQDPDGIFIRKWIPELSHMQTKFIHTPWQAESQMGGYPMPIIDEKIARQFAASQLYGLRKNNTEHKYVANNIVKKHGSRKSGLPRTVGKIRKVKKNMQGELPL